MAVKAEKTELGGHVWMLNTLPATEGLEAFTKLVGLVGEPIGHLSGALSSDGNILETTVNSDLLGTALGAVSKNIAQPGTVALIKKLLDGLTKDNKQINFDMEFAGNYGLLFQLIAWALKINFSSFFVANPALQGLLARVADGQTTRSRKTSTGGSGVRSSPNSAA